MKNRAVSKRVRSRLGVAAAVGVALLGGCGGGGGDSGGADSEGDAKPAASAPTGFVELHTEKCPTGLGKKVPPAPEASTTRVAIPSSLAADLAAYRDAAGTTLIAPKGWECEAGIGSDDSERINAFPPGQEDPGEPPFRPGEVVSLQLYTTCERCIAEYACALFPSARVVKKYGTAGTSRCPLDGLHEQVTYLSPTTALFSDPPNAKGTGTGSGGRTPSLGAMSYTEATGMRKVSCTLAAGRTDLCGGIVSATMLAAPL